MAANGYPQQYSRGQPPPQHYGREPYDRLARHPQPQSRQNMMYNDQAQAHNGMQNRDLYEQNGYNDQYAQDSRWDSRPSKEAQQYGQPDRQHRQAETTREQRYDQGYGAESSNRYDDRRLGGGQVRPPPQDGHGYGPMARSEIRNKPAQMETHAPREFKRIAKEPESPRSIPWDNPFGAFPNKKKQNEGRNTDSPDRRSEGVKSPENRPATSSGRPSTSHETRQEVEYSRPGTSHSQRQRAPLNDGSQYHDEMPSRNMRPQRMDGPAREQDVSYSSQRPMPRRAMTGPPSQELQYDNPPLPQRQPDFYNPHAKQARQQTYQDHPQQQSWETDSRQFPHVNGQAPPLQTNHYQHDVPPVQSRQNRELLNRPVQEETPRERFDPSSYRGVPIRKKPSPELPNFDAISPVSNEKFEDQLTTHIQSPSEPVYSKATYQAPGTARPNTTQQAQQQDYDVDVLSSPLAQFSFNASENPTSRTPTHADAQPSMRQAHQHDPPQDYRPQQQKYNDVYQRDPHSTSQFPPRSASRADGGAPLHTNGHDQRPPVPPLNHLPARPLYEQTYPHNNASVHNLAYTGNSRPLYQEQHNQQTPIIPLGPTRSRDDSRREEQRMGFDPRLRPDVDSTPLQGPQPPPRPQTSNSSRHPPNGGHNGRVSIETFRSNMTGHSNPDSLQPRPVPFRAGLMQSGPAPAPTVSNVQLPPVQRAPPAPQNAEPKPGPVTVQELNALRESFKASPNNHALGLKFAKRLVDASRVLANENGKADSKQTAKNRERYVLDAHKVVKRLIGAGYPEAMFYMADCYGQGLLGLQSDPKEAFSLYQSAAKAGHAQGAYRVAVCCELGPEEGGGTRRDPLKAVQWYKRAATLGDSPAMYKMGMIQLKGLLGQPRSPREAISWLKRAAEKADAENPHALHELALLYESAQSTDIVVRDEKYALQLFTQAAELGYKYSQFRLGSTYEYGLLGCPIDPRLSIVWYSRAAAQGEHQSEFALSGWYLTGSGAAPPGERALLEQSDTEAYLWARKAATSGLTKAEYAMGYYTEVGIGVAANIDEAKKWYFRAAAQNHPKARERLEDLKKGGARMQKTRVSRSQVDRHNEGECSVM